MASEERNEYNPVPTGENQLEENVSQTHVETESRHVDRNQEGVVHAEHKGPGGAVKN